MQASIVRDMHATTPNSDVLPRPSSACPFSSSFPSSSIGDQVSCPFSGTTKKTAATSEFARILDSPRVLTSTGCTRQFCQAGRMTHTDEVRLGSNRPWLEVKKEAIAFLWELHNDGVYTTEQYDLRRREVLAELDATAVWSDNVYFDDGAERTSGWTGTYTQTHEELKHGLRLSWKNARKCIMRSHFLELELCDLRHVTRSADMVSTVIDAVTKAYNGGQMQPTAFVFPPRSTKGAGPMFWSKQLLNFAGYRLDDGSILGDPENVQLTSDIIALGWTPPAARTRWDILPVVAMAENDAPAFGELPAHLRELVEIRHPKYPETFKELDLKWYQFPALCRLGFDIGGVQYTAAPFLGWYMDGEIGVRNLADTFRYNSLPAVAKAIGFDIEAYREMKEYKGIEGLEDLPDYEQLRWLSCAQTELNYAVRHSFLKKGVACSGTLAASSDYIRFDDEHVRKYNYRLNADPVWIAPSIGSIVPLWHRAGAPNYQPKPMIARLRFDPIKAWQRRKAKIGAAPTHVFKYNGEWMHETMAYQESVGTFSQPKLSVIATDKPKVHVYYCSAGTTALKLAEKLHKRTTKVFGKVQGTFGSLNSLNLAKIDPADTLLFVISTTGTGFFPANGTEFEASMDNLRKEYASNPCSIPFAVFGVGDSAYQATYNAAAVKLDGFLRDIGGLPIAKGIVKADVAVEALPMTAFNRWWGGVESAMTGTEEYIETNYSAAEDGHLSHGRMLQTYKNAVLLSLTPKITKENRIIKVAIDVQDTAYQEMSHIRLLPRNSSSSVLRALSALGIRNAQDIAPFTSEASGAYPTFATFFTEFVDLEGSFGNLNWLSKLSPPEATLTAEEGKELSVLDVLGRLSRLQTGIISRQLLLDILLDMPLIRPRTFSIASSALQQTRKSRAELLIKTHENGRFSRRYLSELSIGDTMKFCILPSIPAQDLLDLTDKPIVVFATGTGFAPVRSLLQRRLALTKSTATGGSPGKFDKSPISLFCGFKRQDRTVINKTVCAAARHDLLDMVVMVPSNDDKKRIHDYIEENGEALKEKLLGDVGAYVYVCGCGVMARQVEEKLKNVIGVDVRGILGKRYVEEVF